MAKADPGAAITLRRTMRGIGVDTRIVAMLAALVVTAFVFNVLTHGLFLSPQGLLGHMDRISHIPAEIVQGRYDMICPAVTAFDLAGAWRNARMTIVPDAGHSALEPGIRRALVAAVERFRVGR